MKSEKGLTFLSTAILVIVIALIAFATVYFARIQASKEKAEDVKTDMLLVQAKVKKISGDYVLEHKEEILIGTKLSDMKEEKPIKEFLEKEVFNPSEKNKKYYVLNQENLNDLELNKVILEENSYYIAEYTTGEVYYTKGYMDENGDVHYKATDIEVEVEKKQKVEEDKEESKEENKQETEKSKENK